jgi:hypothetical protein
MRMGWPGVLVATWIGLPSLLVAVLIGVTVLPTVLT